MESVYVHCNIALNKKEKILLENLCKIKNLNVYYNVSSDNLEGVTSYIICDESLKMNNSFNTVIKMIKSIITTMKNNKSKMSFLKGICTGIPVLIFSGGPSSNIDFDKINNIQNEYIIIAVKYPRDLLLKNRILIDFTITSHYSNTNFINENINETNTISCHVNESSKQIYSSKDLNFRKNKKSIKHVHTFQSFLNTHELDMFLFNDVNLKNDCTEFNLAHIMLEVAIPLSVHLGINVIGTFGWDGPGKNNHYYHMCNNEPILKWNKELEKKCEFMYVKEISNILKEKKIYLYKCNRTSPIELDYKNIIDI